jgi:hypothetical protein
MFKSLFIVTIKICTFLFFMISCKEKESAFFSKEMSFSEKDLLRILETENQKPLSSEHLLSWSKNPQMLNSSYKMEYLVHAFLKIDSLKKTGKYQKYIDSLDIGMVRDSRVFLLDTLTYSKDSTVVLWAITQNSYEACPSYRRISIFSSLILKEKFNKTIEVAHANYWSDPPNFYSSVAESKIKNKTIKINKTIIQAEDDDKNDTSRNTFMRRF